jgi:ppGpp synthetase/RelA/SpoT-type nucleotidyltranferase
MSEIDDVEIARTAYVQVRPSYESLASEGLDILRNKLAKANLAAVSITCRAKTIDSFADKITRKQYTKPLSQMTDLAGVRVVCAYESELSKVAEIVRGNFDVRESIDKARDLGVDRMGYNGKAFLSNWGPATREVAMRTLPN